MFVRSHKKASCLILANLTGVVAADVVVSPTEPTGSQVIATSTAFGVTGSRIFDIDANANHARGNRFLVPDGGGDTFRIDSVTIESAGAQTFDGDQITLHIYQGTSDQWNAGSGRVAGEDLYIGTEVTPLTSETFTLNEEIAVGSHVTFELTTPLVVDEDDAYGFFFTYEQGSSSLTSFFYRESGSPLDPNDGRTSITASNHGTATARQMNYWIQGEAIDPGITDSTLVFSNDLISTGDSIDLTITFDTTVDTATLTTPDGTTDLLALDASDEVPGDGMVVVTESPASTFTYEIDVTKTGQTPENLAAEVIVVDPSAEADNSFSTAIKASSPQFYYRFEEPADTGYIIDHSGNSNHTDDIVGPLVQGESSGGVGGSVRFDGDAGILVPATYNMRNAYTFAAVMKVSEFPGTEVDTLLSNADGGSGVVGRSLLAVRPAGLVTSMSGGEIVVADTSALFDDTSCLVHMVLDPDPDGIAETTAREVRIYLNGHLYATTTVGNVAANAGNWILGADKVLGSQFFDGWLDEAAIFTSMLSEAEIEAQAAAFIDEAEDTFLGFYADSTQVSVGGSGTLFVQVGDAATGATLNGNPIDISAGAGDYEIPIMPTGPTTYNLEVTGPGGPYVYSIDVVVVTPPVIISFTVTPDEEVANAPMITIVFSGLPETTYSILSSPDLSNFPFTLGTATTDLEGVATFTTTGFGASEFYQVSE